MDRSVEHIRYEGIRIPPMCGDGPRERRHQIYRMEYSPYVWGWTSHPGSNLLDDFVFPLCVGMDLMSMKKKERYFRIPPMCGDGPSAMPDVRRQIMYSPYVWGWTSHSGQDTIYHPVFPLCVGMDP